MSDEAAYKRGVRVALIGFAITCVVVIATTLVALSTPSGSAWANNFRENLSSSHNITQNRISEYNQHVREHLEWSQGLIVERIDWSREDWQKYIEQERSYWENFHKHPAEQSDGDNSTQEKP